MIADQNVLALFGLAQFVLRAPANHVHAMLDEEPQQFDEAQFARLAADDGEQDHAEGFLHLGVLEEMIEDEVRALRRASLR